MCNCVQRCMQNGMAKCFGTWARILTKCNRIVGVLFLGIYLAIGKLILDILINDFSFKSSIFCAISKEQEFNASMGTRR